MARLSPSASCIVVDVVGARPCGQASLARGSSNTTSACWPRAESACEVMAISGTAKSARIGDDGFELDRLSGPRQRQNEIGSRDHAEVAVRGFARMHEKRRRSGRREGGGDLLADMTALADAGHDDAAADGDQPAHRLVERAGQGAAQIAWPAGPSPSVSSIESADRAERRASRSALRTCPRGRDLGLDERERPSTSAGMILVASVVRSRRARQDSRTLFSNLSAAPPPGQVRSPLKGTLTTRF